MTLEEGTIAPEFRLQGDDGKEHKLSDFKSKTLVLYFYPKDDTPGCTIEAKEFTKYLDQFEKLEATVVGMSTDSHESHCDFRDKYNLKVLLLSDPTKKTVQAYGAYGNKGVFGEGTIRTTYLIKNGKIVKAYPRVQALGHAEKVLDDIKRMK